MSREMRFSNVDLIESMLDNNHFSSVGDVIQAKADLAVHHANGSCTEQRYKYLKQKLEALEDKMS